MYDASNFEKCLISFLEVLFMLKRKIEEKMEMWLTTNKALLIEGARQVGKTFLIREFCKKNGEVDFLITYEGRVLPIGIKSGKTYEKHSALNNLLSNDSYEINEAFVFCNDNYKNNGKIHYFPIYMLSFLVKNL